MKKSKIKPGWYVLYTKARHEKKIHEEIRNRVRSYLPIKKVLRVWSDRKKWVEQPLFPSYLFVYLNNDTEYYTLLAYNGICSFLKFGGCLVRVPQKEIEQVKFFLGHFEEVELTDNIIVGNKKKITTGPFEGYDCHIIRRDKKDKVLVRIESLRQNIVAELNSNYLMSLS